VSEPEVYSPDEVSAIESGYAGLIPVEGKAGGLDLDARGGFFLVPEGRATKSGVTVTTRTAMEIAAVMACATVVAEDVGKMPLQLYRWDTADKSGRTAAGKSTREPLHPLAKLVETRPNQYMTAQAFRETLTLHAMLWGGGYAYKVRNDRDEVRELWPFVPGQCVPRWDPDAHLVYDIWFDDAWAPDGAGGFSAVSVPPSEIFAIAGISWDGICGINRVTLAREVLGLSKRLVESQAKFYGKDQRPSGTVQTEQTVGRPEIIDRIRESWQKQFGPDGDGGVAVLDFGFKYQPMTMSARDADSAAMWRLTIEEACRVFRVQPVKVMHPTGTQSYASIEQLNYSHLTDTLDPWLIRWEQSAERDLLAEVDEQLYWKFNRNAYLRPLPKDRFAIHQVKRQQNLATVNEIRDEEELPPIDDERADDVFAPVGTNPQPGAGRTPAPGKDPAKPGGRPKKLWPWPLRRT
jgi:HK97 family phage portal protein